MGHSLYLAVFIALGLGILIGYFLLFRFMRNTNDLLHRALAERDMRASSFWSFFGHDFKNHLQMISLMAEMGMQGKIVSYVQKVVSEINEWNKMWQSKHPEILFSLLHNRLALDLGTTLTIETDIKYLSLSPVDAPVFWDAFLRDLEQLMAEGSNLKIHILERDNSYYFCFSFTEAREISPAPAEIRLRLSRLVAGYRGNVIFKPLPGKITEVNLIFSKEGSNLDYVLAANGNSLN